MLPPKINRADAIVLMSATGSDGAGEASPIKHDLHACHAMCAGAYVRTLTAAPTPRTRVHASGYGAQAMRACQWAAGYRSVQVAVPNSGAGTCAAEHERPEESFCSGGKHSSVRERMWRSIACSRHARLIRACAVRIANACFESEGDERAAQPHRR